MRQKAPKPVGNAAEARCKKEGTPHEVKPLLAAEPEVHSAQVLQKPRSLLPSCHEK